MSEGHFCPNCRNYICKGAHVCAVCKRAVVSKAAGDEGPETCRACREVLSDADKRAGRCSKCQTEISTDHEPGGGMFKANDLQDLGDPARAQQTTLHRPANERIGSCPACGGDVMRTVDAKVDPFCRSCGKPITRINKSVSSQVVPAGEATEDILLSASCRAQGETNQDAVDRAAREDRARTARHTEEVVAGGPVALAKKLSVAKSRADLDAAIIEAAKGYLALILKSSEPVPPEEEGLGPWQRAMHRATKSAGREAYRFRTNSFRTFDCS